MKHTLRLLILFIILTASQTQAQVIIGGPKVALNVSLVPGVHTNLGSNPGFSIGPYIGWQIPFVKRWYFQQEILFSRRNVTAKDKGGNMTTISTDYLDFPFVLQRFYSRKVNVEAGIQPSVYMYFLSPPNNDYVIFTKNNVNPIDFSVLAGVNYIFDFNLVVGFRFNYTITPVYDSNRGNNFLLQLNVMYRMKLRKEDKTIDDRPWYYIE